MSIKRMIALAGCVILIALCVFQVYRTEPFLQFVTTAPSGEEIQKTTEQIELLKEGWQGTIAASAVTMERGQILLEGATGKSAETYLRGEFGSMSALPSRILRFGRNFYPEELERGARVIILDEPLAIALFRVGDPIGRTVMIEENEFTVIGVARHKRGAGDAQAHGAYVPLPALTDIQMDTLTVWAKPVAGAGAAAKFKADMHNCFARGDLYSLSKERERALLPVWLLLTVIGLLLLLWLFRAFADLVRHLYSDFTARLKHCFAVEMLPRLLGYAVLSLLAFAVLIGISYLWAQMLLRPVDIFPEWIPAVPVEISDILATYWRNAAETCTLIEYCSREVLSLRMWRMMLCILCLLAGAIALHTMGIFRGKRLKKDFYQENT